MTSTYDQTAAQHEQINVRLCAGELPRRKVGYSTVPAVIEWCTERGHPVTTYSPPPLDLSLCRCGEIQIDGEVPMTEAGWQALHETHHTCEYGSGPCGCYTRQHDASMTARDKR